MAPWALRPASLKDLQALQVAQQMVGSMAAAVWVAARSLLAELHCPWHELLPGRLCWV